ncbi:YjcQ family protein [Lysinibacillus xylanilyticus]|uniref:YjcQ family protein n=1 Tax=Lysinibacillus xylanilyticus TaxID=582475 RepID=UPI002B24B96F|nr:hypothetical protein [Lysinibacillus xylanilyticus]MEB2279267.1 YjcQ family protein [Lysinibacillus xylanilyticus]
MPRVWRGYAILKEIDSNHLPLTENDFGVSEDDFDAALGFLSKENYLSGFFREDDRAHLHKMGPSLTENSIPTLFFMQITFAKLGSFYMGNNWKISHIQHI